MMDLMIMRGHMPVRGVVTAEGYATGLTGAQMQPPAIYFDAFFADILLSRFDLFDRAQMLADMTVLTHSLKLRNSGIIRTAPILTAGRSFCRELHEWPPTG
jgi:hypothetical protein